MKKLLLVTSIGLMSSVLLFPAIIGAEQIENEPQVVIDTLDDNGEATSGHIVDDGTLMFESEPNNNGIQQRAYPYPLGKNIGGGTWHYGKMFNSNQAGSVYIHRSKKHSATLTYGAAYKKSVRNPGTDAIAIGTYKSNKNAYYWDNAPSQSVGNYSGGGISF